MKINCLKYYLFLFLILPVHFQAQNPTEDYLNAEVSPTNFDKTEWKSLTEGMTFDTEERPEEEEEELEDIDVEEVGDSLFTGEAWSLFAKFLLIGIFITAIILLIINIVNKKTQKVHRKGSAADDKIIAEIEENIHESDIDSFIKKALADGNYTLAVRLHYLNVLKDLSLKKIIKWKKEKTNRTYLFEIKNTALKTDFRKVTTIFERVWYGETILAEKDYTAIMPYFNLFSNAVKQVK